MDLAKKHDLTFVMAPYLDAHMISALLDFLREVCLLLVVCLLIYLTLSNILALSDVERCI